LKVPSENLLGEENQSSDYIFYQNLIGSLSESATSVSVSELNLKTLVEYVNNQEYKGEKVSQLQSVRHKIAQILTEFECTKQFLYTLYSRLLNEGNLYKEINMLKYLSFELENKVGSNCHKIFNEYGFSKKYSFFQSLNKNGSVSSFKHASNNLLDTISKSIIENEFSKTKGKLKKVKTLVR
jgi:alkylation response protein AidB-like acyl-CoA dehydrogenase